MMRRLALVVLSVVIYGLQLRYALQLLGAPRQVGALYELVFLLFAVYAIGLGRSWELLGARREGLLAWLSPLHDVEEAAPSATEAGATRARGALARCWCRRSHVVDGHGLDRVGEREPEHA